MIRLFISISDINIKKLFKKCIIKIKMIRWNVLLWSSYNLCVCLICQKVNLSKNLFNFVIFCCFIMVFLENINLLIFFFNDMTLIKIKIYLLINFVLYIKLTLIEIIVLSIYRTFTIVLIISWCHFILGAWFYLIIFHFDVWILRFSVYLWFWVWFPLLKFHFVNFFQLIFSIYFVIYL